MGIDPIPVYLALFEMDVEGWEEPARTQAQRNLNVLASFAAERAENDPVLVQKCVDAACSLKNITQMRDENAYEFFQMLETVLQAIVNGVQQKQ